MAVTVMIRSGKPSDDGAPLALTFDAPRVVIGRAESCEVRLPDPSVSARHASLRQRGGTYLLVDEGSTNGTYLGGMRLSPHAPRVVSDGELVRVGRVWFELRIGVATPVSSPQATNELALALVQRALSDLGETAHARVVVIEGIDRQRELSVERPGEPFVLGRGHGADLALDEPDASRRHAQVQRRGEVLLVRDLGSKNGTFLAGNRLEPGRDAVWRVGDELRIGKDRFVYENPAAAALADLERDADERIDEAEEIAPPVGVALPAARGGSVPPAPAEGPREPPAEPHASSAPVAAPLDDEPRALPVAPRARSEWGLGDIVIVVLSFAVFGLSVAGLWLLLRG